MRERLINSIYNSINDLLSKAKYPITIEEIQINLEPTKSKEHGDLASNIAFFLGKKLKLKPIDIANMIVDKIQLESKQ